MWKIVFTLIGTFIGAGFISGKEIYLFFFKYGLLSFLGIFFSCIILSLVMHKVYLIIDEQKIEDYDGFLLYIFKNVKYKNIIKCVINIYLLTSFCIMASGFADFIKQEFFVNKMITFIFFIYFCFYFFSKNVKEITKFNTVFIPLSVIIILLIFFKNINFFQIISLNFFRKNNLFFVKNNNFFRIFFNIFLYANYNLLTIIPMIIVSNKSIKKLKHKKYIPIFFSIIVFLLSVIIIAFFMYVSYAGKMEIFNLQMPMCEVVGLFNQSYKYVYLIVISIAIVTTALSSGFSYLENNGSRLYLVLGSLFFTQINFSDLISFFYPLFGIVGVYQTYKIVKIKK